MPWSFADTSPSICVILEFKEPINTKVEYNVYIYAVDRMLVVYVC